MTPDAEAIALETLLHSEGWRLFETHMRERWGAEALEQRLYAVLDAATPSDDPALTRRILDTFAGVRASLTWPRERARQLREGATPDPRAFAAHRRMGA